MLQVHTTIEYVPFEQQYEQRAQQKILPTFAADWLTGRPSLNRSVADENRIIRHDIAFYAVENIDGETLRHFLGLFLANRVDTNLICFRK